MSTPLTIYTQKSHAELVVVSNTLKARVDSIQNTIRHLNEYVKNVSQDEDFSENCVNDTRKILVEIYNKENIKLNKVTSELYLIKAISDFYQTYGIYDEKSRIMEHYFNEAKRICKLDNDDIENDKCSGDE